MRGGLEWVNALRVAMFRKAAAAAVGGLLLAVGVLGLLVGAQEDGWNKKQVAGDSVFHLGQARAHWKPLIHTAVNLSEITSIKSSFQFRTFDPEGVIFYGDTKNGEDWFVLSLVNGIPLMQISKEGMLVSVEGGMKLNDGKWHTLEVSNQGKFVILEVDGSTGLTVGMQSKHKEEEVISGGLRLALGGILISEDNIIVPFWPPMDACVRGGSWLNLRTPWQAEVDELWSCHQNIQPGSYFPGTGMAVFNSSMFQTDENEGLRIELWGDFNQLSGTIVSARFSPKASVFSVEANNNTKELTITFKEEKVVFKGTSKKLLITFQKSQLNLLQEGDDSQTNTKTLSINPVLTTWQEAHFGIGGLLGEGEDGPGSNFLTGCLEKIQTRGKDLDLDLTVKHSFISSHSCPA